MQIHAAIRAACPCTTRQQVNTPFTFDRVSVSLRSDSSEKPAALPVRVPSFIALPIASTVSITSIRSELSRIWSDASDSITILSVRPLSFDGNASQNASAIIFGVIFGTACVASRVCAYVRVCVCGDVEQRRAQV